MPLIAMAVISVYKDRLCLLEVAADRTEVKFIIPEGDVPTFETVA